LSVNTSVEERAQALLTCCLCGERWPDELLDSLRDSDALFRIVAEGLSDRFEPVLCDRYAELFARVFGLGSDAVERYRRIRILRPVSGNPSRIFVLSRVTLGADVAITSVILDAAKRRFPHAEIWFAGPRKNWELFGADPRILHLEVPYARGNAEKHLLHWPEMRAALSQPGSIVIDPDSRLTQLGLLAVCPEESYYFFESRSFGGDSAQPLGKLARQWTREVLGEGGQPFIATLESPDVGRRPVVCVSLGVGNNPAKRVPDPFEADLLKLLCGSGWNLIVDRGAGGEEALRVERAVAGLPPERIRLWEGSFAGFASLISRADLYAGYDSAGQHVAAATGTPLITVFAGFPCERMFQRWRPCGDGRIEIVRVDRAEPQTVIEKVRAGLQRL
jgi:ADP-heptose:LPS heptosyltransferase